MTTQTIALLGGVVVLLLLLLAVRRRRNKADAAPAPSRAMDLSDIAMPPPAALSGPGRLSAAEGIAEAAPAPVAPAPLTAAEPMVVPQSWTAEQIVREPGWLMPGEVDNVWQADFGAAASVPVPAAAVNGHGHANGNGSPAPDMGALVDGAIPGFDAAAGWGGSLTVELDRPQPNDEPSIPQWDPVEDLPLDSAGGEPPNDLAMPSWSEDLLVGWTAEAAAEPDVGAWAAQVADVAVEPVVPEAYVPEAADFEWVLEPPVAVEVPAEPVAEVAVTNEPVVAWWDEQDEPASVVEVAPDVATDAGTGRFALGGFALQPGHEAIAGVTFRGALPVAPTAWAVAPAGEVAPGTLVLSVDGAVNTGADEVSVLMDEGFAPSAEGFTVRAAARAAGPFAVSGTFRVS